MAHCAELFFSWIPGFLIERMDLSRPDTQLNL